MVCNTDARQGSHDLLLNLLAFFFSYNTLPNLLYKFHLQFHFCLAGAHWCQWPNMKMNNLSTEAQIKLGSVQYMKNHCGLQCLMFRERMGNLNNAIKDEVILHCPSCGPLLHRPGLTQLCFFLLWIAIRSKSCQAFCTESRFVKMFKQLMLKWSIHPNYRIFKTASHSSNVEFQISVAEISAFTPIHGGE